MNRLAAYSQQEPNWTRIEMLIAAYDGVLQRLQTAEGHIKQQEPLKAQSLLSRAQKIVLELYSGVDLSQGEVPGNLRKLYLFVLNCIGLGESINIPAAIKVLTIIRSGLETIRTEANDLERRGQIPHAPATSRFLQNAAG